MAFSNVDPVVILNDNTAVLLSLLSGNSYRQNNPNYDWVEPADSSIEIQEYPTTAFTDTTSTNYIPAKLIAGNYSSNSDKTQLYSVGQNTFNAGNVTLLHRLTKYVYKYATVSDPITAVTSSVLQYLYATYLSSPNPLTLSNFVNVYNLTKETTYNDATTTTSLDTAIDALKSLIPFSATSDPRSVYLPTTSNFPQLASYSNNSGLVSYMDLYNLRTGHYMDPTYGNAYPFFSPTESQQHGLGYLYFLTTQEGLYQYGVFSAYLNKPQPTSSLFQDLNVYDSSSRTTTHNIVADIDQTYWAIANIGRDYGFQNAQPILMCVLIDGVNYSGGDGPYPTDPCGNLYDLPTTSFDIYTCCDYKGADDYDITPTNNNICMTAEALSYQMVNAALTKNYTIFCALHRMFYYMLSVQNGGVGDANLASVDVTPIPQNLSTNRKSAGWPYTSYCMGYQPYLNFYGVASPMGKDASTIKPIYYCRNPYYKARKIYDTISYDSLYSDSGADFNICFAYKLAWLASTIDSNFSAYDTLSSPASATVGASSSITWEYMYNQIKTSILSQTGNVGDGSAFVQGAVLADKYVALPSHDSRWYTNSTNASAIDLALFKDWVVESEAADITGYAAKGSRVLTSNGYVSIENLTHHDKVIFQGRRVRRVDVLRVDSITKYNITVVRIKRHAFGKNRPFRPLLLPINTQVLVGNKFRTLGELVDKRTIRRAFYPKLVFYRVLPSLRYLNLNGIFSKN